MDFRLIREKHDSISTASRWEDASGNIVCRAIERQKNGGDHPRIAPGSYPLIVHPIGSSKFDAPLYSYPLRVPGYKGIIEIGRVPNRTAIEIHAANWASELKGCVAPCESSFYSPERGWTGVNSRKALATLYAQLYAALAVRETFVIVTDLD